MKNQSGFTLIELVLVIIVLGILSATAMPRFVNLSDDAKRATYANISSAMHSSVSLVHSKWLIDGKPAADDYQVDDIYMNAYGYPRVYSEKSQKCEAIFSKLLEGSDIVSEKTETVGSGNGNACIYQFAKNNENKYLYSIRYDEVTGKVDFTDKS